MISSISLFCVTGVRVTSIGSGWITFRFDTAQGFYTVTAHIALGTDHDFDTIDIPATVRLSLIHI